jgi:membrane protein
MRASAFSITWQALQIPFALVFVVIALVMIYRFVLNVAAKRRGKGLRPTDYRRRWFSPGIVFAVLVWLLVSLGFRLYLHFFNSYSATYDLGAPIILMLWFYLTGAAILLGGEINCEYESEVRD